MTFISLNPCRVTKPFPSSLLFERTLTFSNQRQITMVPSSKAVVFARQMAKQIRVTTPSISATRFLSTGDKGQEKQQNPPEPLPNRPLRGERSSNSHREPPARQAHDLGKIDNTLSDDGFLEQFKLGVNQDSQETPKPEQYPQDPLLPPEDSDEIFKKMKEGGLIPNAVAMLDGLCKDGLVQEAMKLFGLMRDKGTIPEVVIYTAVVEGFCKAHKIEDAKRIFRKMQTNGITPNAFSYGVLVQGLYNCNMLDDAVTFCCEMLESGHSPNIPTFVGLVDALCREKGVEQAQSAIDGLNQKGFALNVKAVKEFMDKRAPFPSLAWEAIFKKKPTDKPL
ncbi:pentatricopeptide repeat-containing protein At4g38150 [Arabidopsis lyrata subsp. lyrata]|nr:pentatricopeptide repeat-containing protein At4g38150 [Arabidopsis lyrata subsp. lyrata]|eukprot:XP_020872836.1 pentatricopeptide repeat-containing protein At4g38150 [Arabidopsis lyrata subsp. lyrata]